MVVSLQFAVSVAACIFVSLYVCASLLRSVLEFLESGVDKCLNNNNYYNTHTHPFNSFLSGTAQVSQYQKGKTNLDFTEARDSEWQWHQLGHMQVCASLQTDNHTPALHHSVFYRPDALPAAQPTASKH